MLNMYGIKYMFKKFYHTLQMAFLEPNKHSDIISGNRQINTDVLEYKRCYAAISNDCVCCFRPLAVLI